MNIQGFPNYRIDRDGTITNIKTGKVKQPTLNKITGYMFVLLCSNGKPHNITLHRLIASHFIPNPNRYKCVDHINRNKLDNRIENLRWVTYSQNCINKSNPRPEEDRNIYKDKFGFVIQITRKGMPIYRKWSKTIEEARVLRDAFLFNI